MDNRTKQILLDNKELFNLLIQPGKQNRAPVLDVVTQPSKLFYAKKISQKSETVTSDIDLLDLFLETEEMEQHKAFIGKIDINLKNQHNKPDLHLINSISKLLKINLPTHRIVNDLDVAKENDWGVKHESLHLDKFSEFLIKNETEIIKINSELKDFISSELFIERYKNVKLNRLSNEKNKLMRKKIESESEFSSYALDREEFLDEIESEFSKLKAQLRLLKKRIQFCEMHHIEDKLPLLMKDKQMLEEEIEIFEGVKEIKKNHYQTGMKKLTKNLDALKKELANLHDGMNQIMYLSNSELRKSLEKKYIATFTHKKSPEIKTPMKTIDKSNKRFKL